MQKLARKGSEIVPLLGSRKFDKAFPAAASSLAVLSHVDVERFLDRVPLGSIDLLVTSPPYNTGKEYERKITRDAYIDWQGKVIHAAADRLKPSGSICWQVGNYVENGVIDPLDIMLHPLFLECGMKLRNRIVWRFGHGLHCKRRFSGRYETILWYTKGNDYTFDLDAVRVPVKYPGKRHYKGPKRGQLSSNPRGKNPEDVWDAIEDVWDIPNVKGNHREKTSHPCQFPVGLAERLVLALTKEGDLVCDPFAGVGSAGVAALVHQRRFWGADVSLTYLRKAKQRLEAAASGTARYRSHQTPVFDHRLSSLATSPRR